MKQFARYIIQEIVLLVLMALPVFGLEALPVSLQLTAQNDVVSEMLVDANRGTKVKLEQQTTICVTANQPVSGFYIIFERPVLWKYKINGIYEEKGQDGFLHEYTELTAPTQALEFTFPAGAVICDIYAFGEGDVPAWVQRWQPPCEKADLLVLPTHADDEHLWFGGAMPYYAAEQGLQVQVAYMTHHWAQSYRPHELLDGLWAVGITHYPVISPFADLYASKESLQAAKATYNEDAITAFQVLMLRRFKPEVVLGHDINGEYGHGAHQLNAVTLLDALQKSVNMREYPETAKEYGTWIPKKCYLHLWEGSPVVMKWEEMPLESFNGKTALEVAAEGFACHSSQTQWFSVQAKGKYDCRKFGLVFTRVGPDQEKNDFFENISSAWLAANR